MLKYTIKLKTDKNIKVNMIANIKNFLERNKKIKYIMLNNIEFNRVSFFTKEYKSLLNNVVIKTNSKIEAKSLALFILKKLDDESILLKKDDEIIITYTKSSIVVYNEYIDKFNTLKIDTIDKKEINGFTKVIKLRKTLNEYNLRRYLFKFLRGLNKDINYISILIKIRISNSIFATMGNRNVININDKKDITNFVNDILKYYIDHKNSYLPTIDDLLIFIYNIIDKINYEIIKNKKEKDKYLVLKIKN